MAKYSILAYLLWLIMGFFGGHLFYLGRDNQGILWLTSFGGIFGIGWLRDFYKIPAYVRESNGEAGFLLELGNLMRQRKRPSIWANVHRIVGQVVFGYFYRCLVTYSFPVEHSAYSILVFLLAPLGSAFGTYMVSNIGTIKSKFNYSLVGAYVGELGFGYTNFLLDDSYPSLAVSISMLFTTFAWEHDRRPRGQNVIQSNKCCRGTCCKRVGFSFFVFVLYCSLICSSIYFNASITTQDGETIKVREAIDNFFKSPYWNKLKVSFWRSLSEIWGEYKKDGWEGARKKIIILADVQGEERSCSILGVPLNATLSEIKTKYRDLALEWHPDRHQTEDPEEKSRIQNKFMEIKDAYETLVKISKKRAARWHSKSHG